MKPQSLPWLERMKKFEPTNLVKYASSGLKVASALGWLSFTGSTLGVIDAQLPILLPLAVDAVVWSVDWLAHRWLRSKVSPEGTTEPMADAILDSTKNPDATPTPEAVRAAQRVKAAA